MSSSTGVRIEFDVGGSPTSALWYAGSGTRDGACPIIVLAHGAGGNQNHPWIVTMAKALARRNHDVVTFDFLYAHVKRRVPDSNQLLESTWSAAVEVARAHGGPRQPVFAGGKSMGARIATQAAARGGLGNIMGLVLLGYPLHPPSKPQSLRAAHLPQVPVPMLFVQGARDPFGRPDEFGSVVKNIASGSSLFVVEGGDHSLAPRAASPEKKTEIIERVADEIGRFIAIQSR